MFLPKWLSQEKTIQTWIGEKVSDIRQNYWGLYTKFINQLQTYSNIKIKMYD